MSAKPITPPRSSTRKPLFVECDGCKHAWVAAFLPLAMTDLARVITGASCAHCDGKSINVLPIYPEVAKEIGQP